MFGKHRWIQSTRVEQMTMTQCRQALNNACYLILQNDTMSQDITQMTHDIAQLQEANKRVLHLESEIASHKRMLYEEKQAAHETKQKLQEIQQKQQAQALRTFASCLQKTSCMKNRTEVGKTTANKALTMFAIITHPAAHTVTLVSVCAHVGAITIDTRVGRAIINIYMQPQPNYI